MTDGEPLILLTAEERGRGLIRPIRYAYRHQPEQARSDKQADGPLPPVCGQVTTLDQGTAEIFARRPDFYTSVYCAGCQKRRPAAEYLWVADGKKVGT